MKLLTQFTNKYNNITYKTYVTDNGINVVHLDNPATIDFNFTTIFKAGSSFEIKEQVPSGTAHFLEHMLLNPNSILKSKEEIDRFEQGGKDRPALLINANTTRKNIYLTGYTNEKGQDRLLERVASLLTFSKRKFSNQMEKERGIILAEKSRETKKEKNPYLNSLDFLFKGINDEFTNDVLGEDVDIKNITINDLERYFKNRFTTGNCTFAIQSNGQLKASTVKKIEEISKSLKHEKQDEHRQVNLENKWSVGTFTDERSNGVSFSFMYFDKEESKIDYKEYAIQYIYYRLLDWLAFDILRENMSLIYDFSVFKVSNLTYDYNMNGFKFVTQKGKSKKTLEELYTILNTKSFLFLKSTRGREWFDDVISTYIFPRTTKYNEELAESASTAFLENKEIFNSNIAVREAKKVKIEDVREYLEKRVKIPPHIWVESDMAKEDMLKIVNSSSFSKEFLN